MSKRWRACGGIVVRTTERQTVLDWRERNRERLRRYELAKWYKMSPDKRRLKWRKARANWRKHHPDRQYAQMFAYYAKKKAVTVGAAIDYEAIIIASRGLCGICQQSIRDGETNFDHIVPLSRGGSHTQQNIQLTHASCNRRKGNRAVA